LEFDKSGTDFSAILESKNSGSLPQIKEEPDKGYSTDGLYDDGIDVKEFLESSLTEGLPKKKPKDETISDDHWDHSLFGDSLSKTINNVKSLHEKPWIADEQFETPRKRFKFDKSVVSNDLKNSLFRPELKSVLALKPEQERSWTPEIRGTAIPKVNEELMEVADGNEVWEQHGGGPVSCTFCLRIFNDKDKFVRHYASHKQLKTYSCPICPHRTARKNTIKNHIRTHTGEKPHACPHCPHRTILKGDMNRHIKKHTGERPFACDHCPSRFISKWDCDIHMKRHTGEKPFGCPRCPSRFDSRARMLKHISKKHPEETQSIM